MGNADADEDRGGTGCGNRLASAVAAALEQKATKNSSHDAARPIMVWLVCFEDRRGRGCRLLMNDVCVMHLARLEHMTRKDTNHETPGKAKKLKTRSPAVVVRTGCFIVGRLTVFSSRFIHNRETAATVGCSVEVW
jgi:hypothetical protein